MNTFRHYLLMLLIIAIPIVGYAYNDNEQFSKDGNHYRVVSGTKIHWPILVQMRV